MEELRKNGIEQLFFFQADNPMVRVGDPAFLEHHLNGDYEVSSKYIERLDNEEDLGVFCRIGDTTGVIRYTTLPEQERNSRETDGRPGFSVGDMAAHIFKLDFISRIHEESLQLPFHTSEKTVSFINRQGDLELSLIHI